MIKLFLFLSLFSVTAFADDSRELILERHTRSGFVMPEHYFKKDCTIYRNGDVEVVIQTADSGSGYTARISARSVFEIRQLLLAAKQRAIIVGAVMCDGGDDIVTGHRSGRAILIKEQKDCSSNKWRKGWAAGRVRALASKICGF